MSLKDFTDAYIECALWSSGDEWSMAQLSDDACLTMQRDCAAFYSKHMDLVENEAAKAGHDFWLTRCGHGAGFWDGDWPEPAATILTDASKAFGNVDLYVGDDGLIYS
jgi:hypothetical protein